MHKSRSRLVQIFLLLLILSSSVISQSSQTFSFAQPVKGTETPSYTFSELSPTQAINLSVLVSATGNDLSVSAFQKFIQNELLPFNIHVVLLDIGWQNYPVGKIPYMTWVNNWLTACDDEDIGNVLFVPQLTTLGINSTWVDSLLTLDPSVRTYNSQGQPLNYFSFDNPDVTYYLENDLSLLDSYYGNHTSWVGLSAGIPYSNPYYPAGSNISVMGYSNFSIQSFVNSVYYFRDVNSTGFLQSGEPDMLWRSYVDTPQVIQLSSGVWMESVPYRVAGNGQTGTSIRIRFFLPTSTSRISFNWYGYKVGNPGPLIMQLYPDFNGQPGVNTSLAQIPMPSIDVGVAPGWQDSPGENISLAPGWYWLYMNAPEGNDSNFYYIYQRAYRVTEAEQFQLEGNSVQNITSPILEVTNGSNTLQVYPYQQDIPNPQPTQTFFANHTFSFNSVFFFLSDRAFNSVNATVEIIDENTSTVVGEGILSQVLLHGIQNWSPVILNDTVTVIPGHTYKISVVEPPQSEDSWATVLRGVFTDPASSGFQNQSSYLLFRLELLNLTYGQLTNDRITSNGMDAVTRGYLDAVRFIPSYNETMTSFSILMKNLLATSENYSGEGNLTFSLRPASQNGNFPSNVTILSMTLPGGSIPQNGWVNLTGLNVPLIQGSQYWMVISTNSSNGFSLARLTNAYNYQVLVSPNYGQTWIYPREGPTEFSFIINTTKQILGNFIQNIPRVQLAAGQIYAQPFEVYSPTEAVGLFMGIIERANLLPINSYLQVSIHPDNGLGTPSAITLASGLYSGYNLTFYSLDQIQFRTVAMLYPGIKYWIVIQPTNGTYYLDPVTYSIRPQNIPVNWTAITSTNGGRSWSRISNLTTILSYKIISPANPTPIYNTTQISKLLLEYHSSAVDDQLPHGWNAYVLESEINMFQNLTSLVIAQTNRNVHFYTRQSDPLTFMSNPILMRGLGTIDAKNCEGILSGLTEFAPVYGTKLIDIVGYPIQSCHSALLSDLVGQSQLMQYVGPPYGDESAIKVLVVGNSVPTYFIHQLASIFQVQFAVLPPGTDSKLLVNLSSYNAVLWTTSELTGVAVQDQLQNYVKAGGNLLFIGYPPSWATPLLGFNFANISSFTPSENASSNKFIQFFTMNTIFQNNMTISHPTPSSILAENNELLISINSVGEGRTIALSSIQDLLGTPYLTQGFLVLYNILQYVSTGSVSPISVNLGPTYLSDQIEAYVYGQAGGPVLVWMTNPNNQTLTVRLGLNLTAFGIKNGWKLIDPFEMNSINGTSETLQYFTTLKNNSWGLVYVGPQQSNYLVQYSNTQLLEQLEYPNQIVYSFGDTANRTILLAISSDVPPKSITVGQGVQLNQFGIVQSLLNNSQGWYYNSSSATLFVKFISSEGNTMRVFPSTPVSQPFRLFVFAWGISLLGAFVIAEGLTFIMISIRRRSHIKMRKQSRSVEHVP